MNRAQMSKSEFDLYVARKLQKKANNARERGIGFSMTFASMKNILSAKRCYYTGIPLELPKSGVVYQAANALTIDRIDSSKPYEAGNVVACCNAFNSMKGQAEAAGIEGLKIVAKAFGKVIKRMEDM